MEPAPGRKLTADAWKLLPFGPSAQVFGEELFGGGVEFEAVLGTGEAVALVLEEQVLVVYAALLHGGDYLLGLCLLDAGVVRALGDEQGSLDPIHEEERRAALEEVGFGLRVSYALGKGGYERLPVGRDALYKGDDVRRAHDVHGAPEKVRGERDPGEGRVPAVGAAVDGDPLGVGDTPLDGPPYGVHEVVVHFAAPLPVAGIKEIFAVARRAVDVQDHRQVLGLGPRGQRQVALHLEPVAGGEGDGLHLRQRVVGEVGPRVEEVLAPLRPPVVGVVRGAAVVGVHGDEPVLVGPVAAGDGEVPPAEVLEGPEVLADGVVEYDPLRPRPLDPRGLDRVGLRVDDHPRDVVARILDQNLRLPTRQVHQDEPGRVRAPRVEEVHLARVFGEADGAAREGVLLVPRDEGLPALALPQQELGAAIRGGRHGGADLEIPVSDPADDVAGVLGDEVEVAGGEGEAGGGVEAGIFAGEGDE